MILKASCPRRWREAFFLTQFFSIFVILLCCQAQDAVKDTPSTENAPALSTPALSTPALSTPAVSAPNAGSVGNNYHLTPNDLVEIRVFQEPDLDTRVRVSGDGSISMPLIGTVHVAGASIDEAAGLLRKKYGERYLVNPQLSVTVVDYSKRRFTVLGQVQRPGAYPMPDNEFVTLLEAVGMAGGYTRIAEPSKITVKRIENGVESLLTVNAKRMARGGDSAKFQVKPGDVISVPESIF